VTNRPLLLLGSLLALTTTLTLACSGEDGPPQDDPAPAGFAGFREFAAAIRGALEAEDAGFFLARAPVQEGICTGRETEPPCAGQQAGAKYRGNLLQAGDGDPLLIPEEQYAEQLLSYLTGAVTSLSDQLGAGEVTLVALATPPRSDDRIEDLLPSGRSAYYAITSGIVNRGSDNSREVHVLVFSPGDADWDYIGEVLVPGGGIPAEVYAGWLSGSCRDCYDYFERWEGTTP